MTYGLTDRRIIQIWRHFAKKNTLKCATTFTDYLILTVKYLSMQKVFKDKHNYKLILLF